MELRHDPMTKQQVKELLYDFLYLPVIRSFQERLKRIILENCKLQGATHPSMMYRGEVYQAADSITPHPKQLPMLDESLKEEMDEYLKETAYLNNHEVPYVLGYLNRVLDSSDNLADYLRLLPDSVHRPIGELIASCRCRTAQLAKEDIDVIRKRNAVSIELIRQRLTVNLLL